MGGTLVISKEMSWTPHSSIYNFVIKYFGMELHPYDKDLANDLLASVESGIKYCDISEVLPESLRQVTKLSDHAYINLYKQGLKNYKDSLAAFGALQMSSLLKALLYTDPRSNHHKNELGQIVFNHNIVWIAEWWLVDMVIEHLIAFILPENMNIANTLFEMRGNNSHYDLDLKLDLYVKGLKLASEYISIRYGNGGGYDAQASKFFAEVEPALNQFSSLVIDL